MSRGRPAQFYEFIYYAKGGTEEQVMNNIKMAKEELMETIKASGDVVEGTLEFTEADAQEFGPTTGKMEVRCKLTNLKRGVWWK